MRYLIKHERQDINHSDYIYQELSSNYNLTPLFTSSNFN
ncbi:hypothetical protein LRHMDP2_82 [Lacticaseibacillus rhamnosus LRHMDP2]|uniref:Uncharacterized protein n=1 Tax=Lacticaseibacillus rhamnosus LRHMDP3 TaxID=1203259 RepID=A0AB33XTU9_LACRH|nr:hypothetical protein LRHMDP3_1684 [Lacticaseibacillus rhamnosus LRHMDP3]EKS53841.1 hypothetical protein LRHMDP2_82 [Lacticaseibacillus rhamnosus LRHMDP2]